MEAETPAAGRWLRATKRTKGAVCKSDLSNIRFESMPKNACQWMEMNFEILEIIQHENKISSAHKLQIITTILMG